MSPFLVICIMGLVHVSSTRIPLIIDTNIGTQFDDAMAVTYSLSRLDVFDIKLILTSTYNTSNRALLTAKMLQFMNNSDIDIGIGIPTPSPTYYESLGGVGPQFPWAQNYSFSQYGPGKIYSNGIEQATKLLHSASPSNPIWIVAISPFINIAQIFDINPKLKENARIITTSGCINHLCQGYNTIFNVSAAEIVYNYTDTIPYNEGICGAPGDTTDYFQIYGENYQNMLNNKNDSILTQIILQNYQVWYDNGG
eukprot:356009_1